MGAGAVPTAAADAVILPDEQVVQPKTQTEQPPVPAQLIRSVSCPTFSVFGRS